MREPRPGSAAKKPDLLRPGATITVAGLAPEAGGGLAAVRWGECLRMAESTLGIWGV